MPKSPRASNLNKDSSKLITDIGTTEEKELGRIVKERYHTDIFIITEFPVTKRPFYTQKSHTNPEVTNSYDIILRGNEILSGAQRVNDYETLMENIEACGVSAESLGAYPDSFKYGSYKHGGGGFGLERLVMFYLGLDNIRQVSMYPRDPSRLVP